MHWTTGCVCFGLLGALVRSSCLNDKHYIHWAISTAHVFLFCVYVSCMWIHMGLVCGWMLVKTCLFSSFSYLFFEMWSFEPGTHWLDYILSKHPRLQVCTATFGIFFMGVKFSLLHQWTHWAISVAPLFKEWNSSLYIEFHLWVYLVSLTLALEISHIFLMFRHIQGARQQKPFLILMKTVFKWRMIFLVSVTIPLYCIRS